VGRIAERPWAAGGELSVRPTLWLSITFDHRLVDGAPAARFLEALALRLA
jgi:pyruvate dehydrogenase E2 component (dihydrolipoamide acetyltransferase)